MQPPPKHNLAIIAGGGHLPVEIAHAAVAAGHQTMVLGLAEEADLKDLSIEISSHSLGWGQIGALLRHLKDHQTDQLVIVGSVSRRPDYKALKFDWGAMQAVPKLIAAMRAGGDGTVLDKIALAIEERGYQLVGAHEIAPSLLAAAGHVAGPTLKTANSGDLVKAAQAAWTAGHLDMGQGAVSVGGRIVSMEGAEGTDGQLKRVAEMRRERRFSAGTREGVLAKCTRPNQDLRLDMPAIGPKTIVNAAEAKLAGIAIEAERVLITQRDEVERLCHKQSISLVALSREEFVPPDREDHSA